VVEKRIRSNIGRVNVLYLYKVYDYAVLYVGKGKPISARVSH